MPVASKGAERGDHAKVDVLWISFSFMVVLDLEKYAAVPTTCHVEMTALNKLHHHDPIWQENRH